jgi:hypothetical protein
LIKEHITQLSSSELKKSRNNPEEGLGHWNNHLHTCILISIFNKYLGQIFGHK